MSRPAMKPRPVGVRPGFAVAAIVALAALLCFLHLGRRPLWLDEGYSVTIARLDWPIFWTVLWERQANMGLYYLLLRGWMQLGGSEAMVRALSVLPALGTLPIVYLIGKRLFSVQTGLMAAMLLAVNPEFVRYAQEARSYTLVMLLCALATYLFLDLAEEPSRRVWLLYVTAGALAVYAQLLAALVLLTHALTLYRIPGSRKKPFWLAAVAIFVLAAPMWLHVLLADKAPFRWIPPLTVEGFYAFLFQFTGNHSRELTWIYASLCALAVFSGWKEARRQHTPGGTGRSLLLVSWLGVPVAVLVAVSLMLQPMFVPRYLLISLPALALLAARGIAGLGWKVARLAVLATVVWLTFAGVRGYYMRDFDVVREDFRSLTDYVTSYGGPGDALVFYPPQMRYVYDYYDRRRGQGAGPAVILPAWRTAEEYIKPKLPSSVDARHARVWFVVRQRLLDPPAQDVGLLQQALEVNYKPAGKQGFAELMVLKYERRRQVENAPGKRAAASGSTRRPH